MKTVFAAAFAAALITATPSFAMEVIKASSWDDYVAKVKCDQVKPLPDGRWVGKPPALVGGQLYADALPLSDDQGATLKKKCAAPATP
ncbi:MAG TPA: hypothetical protein VGU69_12415 [Rhizomicrobium sp.]|nr:hypothetical protein [Rhizomicrobium sp.]